MALKTKLRELLANYSPARRRDLAVRLGTTDNYLLKIAGGWQVPGTELAVRLTKAFPALAIQDLLSAKQERVRATNRKNRRKPASAR